MEKFVLKQDIVDKIKGDQILYGQVAFLMDTAILSMRTILNERSEKLTQASVLNHLKNYLGLESESELLEVVSDSGCNNNTQEPQLQEVQ
jgi:hypothetical protein